MADQDGNAGDNAQVPQAALVQIPQAAPAQVPQAAPAQIPQAAMAVNNLVTAVALKLPTFWHKDSEFWFLQAESQFDLAGITQETTKFHHVVRTLDSDTARQVRQAIRNPTQGREYTELKRALIAAYEHGPRERANRLFNMGSLGDRKPSQLLNEMKALMEDEPINFLFTHLWLSYLPDDIRITLAQRDDPLDALAKIADKLWHEKSLAPPALLVAAAAKPQSKEKQDPTNGQCYFHRRFGAKAKNFKQPCNYSAALGNATAGQ